MDKHFTLTSHDSRYTGSSSQKEMSVGQTEACDLRIANPSPYADRVAAKIALNRDGQGWHMVRIGQFPISVNGLAVNRVHYLEDGDLIDFGGGERYRFHIVEGEQDKPSLTVVRHSGRAMWSLAVSGVLIACVALWIAMHNSENKLSDSQIADIEQSLVKIETVEVAIMDGDSVVRSHSLVNHPVGTAFITDDSLLVTARHCVEPWLNIVKPMEIADIPDMADELVKMALEVETHNQLSDSLELELVAHLTLTYPDGSTRQMNTRDFKIDRSRDEIVELGDYDTDLFWRNISHRHGRSDMMLGDVAMARAGHAGKISLADEQELREIMKPRTRLIFFGFPHSEQGATRPDHVSDELRQELSLTDDGHIFMLAHGGQLVPGYSGGPVIANADGECRAVGVISVLDAKNSTRSYSVPSSQIKTMKDYDSSR